MPHSIDVVRRSERLRQKVEVHTEKAQHGVSKAGHDSEEKAEHAIEFARHAERLGFERTADTDDDGRPIDSSAAIEAKFITPQDPIVLTADGSRLPAIPVDEAITLNRLRDQVDGRDPGRRSPVPEAIREAKDGTLHGRANRSYPFSKPSENDNKSLRDSVPPAKTNPLFPPLPMYGPPTFARDCHALYFRFSAACGSMCFLLIVILGALFTAIPSFAEHTWQKMRGNSPVKRRPFYEEEEKREKIRQRVAEKWLKRQKRARRSGRHKDETPAQDLESSDDEYQPTEGGKDPLVCDAGYYARRVGLDIEEYKVQTEDGFVIDLWHVYNPKEYTSVSAERRARKAADNFVPGFVKEGREHGSSGSQYNDGNRRYPILLMHGLLQSAGAYCCNDDDSLAFYLTKAGFDVWLGNNRCGFEPEHVKLQYGDPRMWAWNIRQMGVIDLPALISRVLEETGFEKLGLICHSQGTTQTLVALAKEQRPDIGERISVFCGLAPAAYSGPLIKKGYFKFMSILTPSLFRMVFGIHSFIPFMMMMHKILPGGFYGDMGYLVFSFLFDWTDVRWDRRLRSRMFQFAPVYVSSESMRWWLGRDCFAKQKCILSTREEGQLEDEEDEEEDYFSSQHPENTPGDLSCHREGHHHKDHGRYSWYDEKAPPMAFWVGGNDNLVDGKRLLRRFERGREPYVDVVHKKIIENYEHLDVIWAIDVIEKVSKEVKEVLWKTAPPDAKSLCRTPVGCGDLKQWKRPRNGHSLDSDRTVVEHGAQGDEERQRKQQKREEEKDMPSP